MPLTKLLRSKHWNVTFGSFSYILNLIAIPLLSKGKIRSQSAWLPRLYDIFERRSTMTASVWAPGVEVSGRTVFCGCDTTTPI